MVPRYAIYYTPPPFSALAKFGASVLGYDCFEGQDVPFGAFPGLEEPILKLVTVEPKRYGFHATIVAPFYLGRYDEADLVAAAEKFAAETLPVAVGGMDMRLYKSFVVLVPRDDCPALSQFAAECLRAIHPYAAPLSNGERERRTSAGLTPAQIALLDRWGYPYVLDQFQFHMTLAGPVPDELRNQVRDRLWAAYQEHASSVLEIDAISVLRQDDPAARFRILRRCRLRR